MGTLTPLSFLLKWPMCSCIVPYPSHQRHCPLFTGDRALLMASLDSPVSLIQHFN
jgi:hypothetical protein